MLNNSRSFSTSPCGSCRLQRQQITQQQEKIYLLSALLYSNERPRTEGLPHGEGYSYRHGSATHNGDHACILEQSSSQTDKTVWFLIPTGHSHGGAWFKPATSNLFFCPIPVRSQNTILNSYHFMLCTASPSQISLLQSFPCPCLQTLAGQVPAF